MLGMLTLTAQKRTGGAGRESKMIAIEFDGAGLTGDRFVEGSQIEK